MTEPQENKTNRDPAEERPLPGRESPLRDEAAPGEGPAEATPGSPAAAGADNPKPESTEATDQPAGAEPDVSEAGGPGGDDPAQEDAVHDEPATHEEHEDVEQSENYHELSKEELATLAENLCEEPDYATIRARVNPLREAFDELAAAEQEAALEKFVEKGGDPTKFSYRKDEPEKRFGRAIRRLNKKRIEFIESRERQRTDNLRIKREILEKLKELIQNEDNLGRAFNTFHDLQARWRETGPVPQADVKDLWLTYKTFTDQFYNFIRLNKELQDLDHKKNLELKIGLCEQIDELALDPSINKAMQKLLAIQNTWREIGSVPRERREEIGERYKEACRRVYDRRKVHTRDVRAKQQENAKLKAELCDKVAGVELGPNPPHKEVMEALGRVQEVQREWRTIGFAGPAKNEELWKRFRQACNGFYKQKNEFFNDQKKEWQANLQAKTELCIQAEGLAGSTDWKKAGAELRRLHEQWKKTGFAGRRQSDEVWKRFRSASDAFYEARRTHFKDMDATYGENLEKKRKLVSEIESSKAADDRKANLELVRGFQRQWSEIGMVPIKEKDGIYHAYRKAVDSLFGKMGIGKNEQEDMQYKQKVEHLKSGSDSGKRMHAERKSITYKLSQLQSEVTTWENNLGFLAKSKNAESIIKDFESKIGKAKSQIEKLRKQLSLLKQT